MLSATKSVVTVEEIIEDFDTHPNAVILPHWTIDYIAEVPGLHIPLTRKAIMRVTMQLIRNGI